ncbi:MULTISPECIES: phosphoribosylamine--glycine ligase [Trueperella]|uniref:phosphoribosylamine--glycine ligase n=1 Tax=Trueperella TaxID=1069494 RepID=UPI0008390D8B|nr:MULTISPECIES: phosphoribosylamine--glycine ligase [Trueperella]MCM3907383.1 phosphoribosylamine--glycine ligase [Trueperella bernardiae]OCW61255.1 phosphoribosylamine--glycine ligase [Trueperella bernardiae]OFS67177.1 phosphoribosylamine--glycine ligase [Trueperella sp. HMSC08H06]WIM08385.1 phosphoribosylamine--glycine ligase [Trueperella bernardiae]
MKVMVIGSGGREHAIVRKLAQSPRVSEIVVAPGNAGIAREDGRGAAVTRVPIGALDIDELVTYAASNAVDFAVVAPDDPLVAGAVDAFAAAGIPAFGPNAAAAQIEGSKSFAKAFMARHAIPTAGYAVYDDEAAALAHIATCPLPVVVKADGLALGKGVTVALTREDAESAVREAMAGRFGESGKRLVIEEFLTGPEVTVLAFTDGKAIRPMVSAMDHKRLLDGDQGPNTGGMGVIAPSPLYTPEVAQRCEREIFRPTVDGLAEEGTPFTGCLYFGLILTEDGPKVIEYNCRFGDPETQVVLPLLESDLLTIFEATTNGTLGEVDVDFAPGAAACVVMSAEGYPASPRRGDPIDLPADLEEHVVMAGVAENEGQLVTNGGRVLGVVGQADTLAGALDLAYERTARISFAGAHYRTDIAHQFRHP